MDMELPKKLQAIIADGEHCFVVRIGTDPRTTDTGIANIIPIDRDIGTQGRKRTIEIAEHLVKCWNGWDELVNKEAQSRAVLVKFEQLAADELIGLQQQRDDLLATCKDFYENKLEPDKLICLAQGKELKQLVAKATEGE